MFIKFKKVKKKLIETLRGYEKQFERNVKCKQAFRKRLKIDE